DRAEYYGARGLAQAFSGDPLLAVGDAEESLRRGGPQPDAGLLYRAAYTYAVSALHVVAGAKRGGRHVVDRAHRYQDRAVALPRASSGRQPLRQREAFFRENIQAVPALTALRRRIPLADLRGSTPSARP